MDEDDVRRAIGLADSCELMAAAFAFPDAELAAALADGSLQSDALACLADVGAATATVDKAAAALSAFDGADVVGLADRMRKGHTILYLTPGVDVPIWPYEASFRYTAEGHEGSPALFRSARTLDVERHMREAGVLPKTARKEPSDSVWNEFSFLSFLYGSLAAAEQEGRRDDAAVWSGRAVRFWDEHLGCWIPAFMGRTREEAFLQTYGVEYAALALMGELFLSVLDADIDQRKKRC